MRNLWVRTAWSITLCAFLACVLVVQYEQYRATLTIAERITMQPSDELITSYISGGQTIQVITKRQVGETKPHWEQRHIDDIKARWATDPPDG